MESVPSEGTLSRILMGTIQIDLEVCAAAEFVRLPEEKPADANAPYAQLVRENTIARKTRSTIGGANKRTLRAKRAHVSSA